MLRPRGLTGDTHWHDVVVREDAARQRACDPTDADRLAQLVDRELRTRHLTEVDIRREMDAALDRYFTTRRRRRA